MDLYKSITLKQTTDLIQAVGHRVTVLAQGEMGIGKSSMLNCISGVYRPQGGSVSFRGENITDLPPHGRAQRRGDRGRVARAGARAPAALRLQAQGRGRHVLLRPPGRARHRPAGAAAGRVRAADPPGVGRSGCIRPGDAGILYARSAGRSHLPRSEPMSAAHEPAAQVLSVAQLTSRVRSTLEANFLSVWVAGEVSNFTRASSGHWYFTLKDDHAQIKAVAFRGINLRLRFDPRNGTEVVARGRLTVYDPKGEYQFVVEEMQPKGVGAAELALRQLKEKLLAKGYFSPSRKRPLPRPPQPSQRCSASPRRTSALRSRACRSARASSRAAARR